MNLTPTVIALRIRTKFGIFEGIVQNYSRKLGLDKWYPQDGLLNEFAMI
jgi:hypothetical protein